MSWMLMLTKAEIRNFYTVDEALLFKLLRDDKPPSAYGMDVDMLLPLEVEPAEACRCVMKCMRKLDTT